jgi:hypothetical protein
VLGGTEENHEIVSEHERGVNVPERKLWRVSVIGLVK